MRTGKLRHFVEIHALTVVEDDIGNQTETWAKVAETWAAIEPLKGNNHPPGNHEAAWRCRPPEQQAGVQWPDI
jgi:head-tail adaptor